jgi:hypothetical protein
MSSVTGEAIWLQSLLIWLEFHIPWLRFMQDSGNKQMKCSPCMDSSWRNEMHQRNELRHSIQTDELIPANREIDNVKHESLLIFESVVFNCVNCARVTIQVLKMLSFLWSASWSSPCLFRFVADRRFLSCFPGAGKPFVNNTEITHSDGFYAAARDGANLTIGRRWDSNSFLERKNRWTSTEGGAFPDHNRSKSTFETKSNFPEAYLNYFQYFLSQIVISSY